FQRRILNVKLARPSYGSVVELSSDCRPQLEAHSGRSRMSNRFGRAAIRAACLAAGLIAAANAPAHADAKPYKIYLSNSVIGNDWLQQMIRSAEVAAKKGPLAGRVDLHVETVENTTQAQINSLNNIIAAKPDAIIVHAGSVSALDPTLERACAAGIVVVSFS